MALLEDLLKYLDRGNSLEHCKGASGRKIDGRVRVGFSGDEWGVNISRGDHLTKFNVRPKSVFCGQGSQADSKTQSDWTFLGSVLLCSRSITLVATRYEAAPLLSLVRACVVLPYQHSVTLVPRQWDVTQRYLILCEHVLFFLAKPTFILLQY